MKKSKLKRMVREGNIALDRADRLLAKRQAERDAVMRALVIIARNAAIVEDVRRCE